MCHLTCLASKCGSNNFERKSFANIFFFWDGLASSHGHPFHLSEWSRSHFSFLYRERVLFFFNLLVGKDAVDSGGPGGFSLCLIFDGRSGRPIIRGKSWRRESLFDWPFIGRHKNNLKQQQQQRKWLMSFRSSHYHSTTTE